MLSLRLSCIVLVLGATLVNAAVLEYEWCVDQFLEAFDGVKRLVYGVNGRPGSEARIIGNVGDEVMVHLINNLTEPTCIHWHGIPQHGTPDQDGASGVTQCSIAPGRSAHYRFFLTNAGTYWWHSHDNAQYVDGLRGPIIVHERPELLRPIERAVAGEFIVLLSDWYHEQSAVLLQQLLDPVNGSEPIWDAVLINDRGRFNCSQPAIGSNGVNTTKLTLPCSASQPLATFNFAPGASYRLRLINVGALAVFDFSIDHHVFRVVAADAMPVQTTRPLNMIRINVAQRYDLIVQATPQATGGCVDFGQAFAMRAKALSGAPWTFFPPGKSPTGFDGIAVVQYADDAPKDPTDVPTSTPWPTVDTMAEVEFRSLEPVSLPAEPDLRVVMQFTITKVNATSSALAYVSIDGRPQTSFEMPMAPTLFEVARGVAVENLPVSSNIASLPLGAHVEILVINEGGGAHPFHMHGDAVWVAGAGTMAAANSTPTNLTLESPVKRDVYTVPPCTVNATSGACLDVGYLVLRHEADNSGVWMLHCHIEWHLAMGLAMLFVEGAKELATGGLGPYLPMARETCADMHMYGSDSGMAH